MKHALFSIWLLLSLSLINACGSEAATLTEIVVEVDSDLSVPDELDRITLSVDGAKADTAAADLTHGSVPRTLGMVHEGGPLGPFTLHATGWRSGKPVVEASLATSFVRGKRVQVAIDLERACVDVTCATGETCSGGSCTPIGNQNDGGLLSGDGGVPTCSIEQPAMDDVVQVDVPFGVRGSCSDVSGAVLTQGLTWDSDRDGRVASRPNASVTLQSAGGHTLSLCAPSPSDPTLIGCAEVTISAVTPGAPTAMITGSTQGATTKSPFRSNNSIVFMGTGSGTDVSLSWSDSLQGDFGSGSTATLTSPSVGKHTVTLTVTDADNRKTSATTTFAVLAPGQATLFENLSSANGTLGAVTAVSEGSGGIVYAASQSGRLYALNLSNGNDAAQLALDRPPLDGNLRDVFVDTAHGLLYVATSNGLTACSYSSAGGASSCMTYRGGELPSDNLYAVLRVTGSGVDRLLVGTDSGLFLPDNAAGDTTGDTRVNERTIRGLAGDANTVWIATDQGLYRYTVGSGSAMRITSGSSSASWTSVAVGTGGNVWLGSASGLTRFTPGTDHWSTWKTADGLVSNQVNSVAVEQQLVDGIAHDILWIGTSAGVSRFDPVFDTFQSFTTSDGLPSNTVHEVLILADGSKLFATDAGVAHYVGR